MMAVLATVLTVGLTAQGGPPQVCSVVNNNATTLTAFTAAGCANREPGLAFYITDILATSSVIATVTTDQQLILKYGTGSACGTGTVTLWNAYNLAWAPVVQQFQSPLKVPSGQDLCWIHAAGGSKTFLVQGYLAPQ